MCCIQTIEYNKMPKERGSDDRNSSGLGGRDKSRGIKHQRDKTKYKAKSVKDAKHVPPNIKCNLGSNWDRYETENETCSSHLSSSTDFSILSNAPITQGQHFQFKQDKFLVEMSKTSQDMFSLDLNMLKHSILTIPFYDRVGIGKKCFTENEISIMNRNAASCQIRYSDKYSLIKVSTEGINEQNQEHDNSVSNNKTESLDIPSTDNDVTVETSELVNKMVQLMKSPERGTVENSEEDLEQWLDDILDD